MKQLSELFAKQDIRIFEVILIVFGSWILTYVLNFLLLKVITQRTGRLFESKKIATLAALLRSIVKYLVFFVAFLMILDIYNVPTTSILASAGVAGLAIGFGAQSLIKDVISGFFIIFEDQYTVGEHISTAKLEGVVEEIGLRATKLKDFNGSLHIIPNGLIDIVTNYSRGKIRAMVDVGVAYKENIDKALAVISEACSELAKNIDSIVEGPTVLGVTKIAESEVTIRIVAFTKPGEQWSVERAMLKAAKEHLEKAKVEVPYPRVILSYSTDTKEETGSEENANRV